MKLAAHEARSSRLPAPEPLLAGTIRRLSAFVDCSIGVFLALSVWASVCSAQSTPPSTSSLKGVKVAITVDDLPTHGDPFPGIDRDAISKDILAALEDNNVKGAWGFANKAYGPDEIAIFREWLAAGYPLGNHTYTHPNLNQVSVSSFESEIARQDRLLASLESLSPLIAKRRMFRYPFLAEGETLAKRNAIRRYLSRNGYRTAEVTVDYMDWAWTDAYARCRNRKDDGATNWLRAHVNDAAERALRHSVDMARKLFNRDIEQILLIHIGAFDALTLDEILRDWRGKGVILIPLEEALADPVYQINPNYAYDGGRTFLEQIAEAREIDTTPFSETTYTQEAIEQVCKQSSDGTVFPKTSFGDIYPKLEN